MGMLTIEDRMEIQELTAKHIFALDSLQRLVYGNSAEEWADTFTPHGVFEIHSSDNKVLFSVQGRDQLLNAHGQFPDIASTRHWIGNLLIEPDPEGAMTRSYIIAMNISVNPASVIRTGTYRDIVVIYENQWKFKRKILTLDPSSPSAG